MKTLLVGTFYFSKGCGKHATHPQDKIQLEQFALVSVGIEDTSPDLPAMISRCKSVRSLGQNDTRRVRLKG